ncbi:uncharacterized protein LOC124623410 [Schistocerca americana]|uniref:uncharacterized protein LOC124623410 n=1 Tax=Schistocerca americana TaxID=7009 RepID=UPI001F4F4237|nr:uncharacterized protein LOC124623410 [Schistocerca americana]
MEVTMEKVMATTEVAMDTDITIIHLVVMDTDITTIQMKDMATDITIIPITTMVEVIIQEVGMVEAMVEAMVDHTASPQVLASLQALGHTLEASLPASHLQEDMDMEKNEHLAWIHKVFGR